MYPLPDGNRGGRIRTVAPAKIPHRDVHQSVQPTLTTLGPGVVYSRLLRVRTAADVVQPSLELECDLCESWVLLESGSYDFYLRPGIQWQDIPPVNGRALTASDVACSYERLSGRKLTPETFSCNLNTPVPDKTPNASLLANVTGLEVLDDLTLRINVDPAFPDADFLLALADGHSKIVAVEAINENNDLKSGPDIGTGPWRLASVDTDIGTTFEGNPTYFEEGLPFLDEFASLVIRDRQAALGSFLTDQVQVLQVSPEEWNGLQDEGRALPSVVVLQGGTGLVLSMNASQPPFDNLDLRRAVLQALDPWDYVSSIWGGQGNVTVGIPAVQADWLLTREEMRGAYFADPAAARQTLNQLDSSGPVDFDLLVGDFGDLYRIQGRRLEQDLRESGFNPRVQFLTPPQYAERVILDKRYEVALGVLPPSTSTNSFLLAALHSKGQWNLAAHNDQALDQLIENQAVQQDLELRGEQLREIQRHVLEQAYLFSPVTGATRWVMAPEVQGFFPTTAGSEYIYWAKAWLQS